MKRVLSLLTCIVIVLCVAACGKAVEVSDTVSDIMISDYDEISFQVKYCNPEAVTYTVCSSKKDFLFYEGHEFAYIQKYADGDWHFLAAQPQVSTGDFKWCSIPTEEQQETISIDAQYGGKLEAGTYRLVASCSRSATPPENSEPEQSVYLAAEFEIDG